MTYKVDLAGVPSRSSYRDVPLTRTDGLTDLRTSALVVELNLPSIRTVTREERDDMSEPQDEPLGPMPRADFDALCDWLEFGTVPADADTDGAS